MRVPGGRRAEAGQHGFWDEYGNIFGLIESLNLDEDPLTGYAEQGQYSPRGLEAICEGGMRAYNTTVVDCTAGDTLHTLTLQGHLATVSESIAALIANVCHSSAILSGHDPDSVVAQACSLYGENLAMARHLVGEAPASPLPAAVTQFTLRLELATS